MSLTLDTPNLVSRPEIYDWVRDEFTPRLIRVRDNRRPLEERWKGYDRIWLAILDKQSYQGRHKAFLAAGRQMIETMLHTLRAGFFPLSEWFSVEAKENIIEEERARAVHALQRHFLDETLRLRDRFEPFARQLLRRGTSPVKHVFEDQERMLRRLVRRESPRRPGKFMTKIVQELAKAKYGPTLRVIDLYSWYVWPETVQELSDAELVFEDKEVTAGHVRAMAERWLDPDAPELGYVYERIEEALDQSRVPPEFKQARRERLARMGLVDPLDELMRGLGSDRALLSECYVEGEIPGATHRDDETGEEVETGPASWLITVLNSTWPIRVQQNPFWYKTVPYHAPRLWRELDEFYGHSVLEATDRLQYILNDLMNHTLDGIALSNNPIAIIDPNAHPRINSLRVLPLAKWMVRPDAVRFDRPTDTSGTGLQAVSFVQGMIHDFGLSAVAQGQPAARGRGRAQNTAAGLGLLLQSSSQIMETILDKLDRELGQPLLQRNMEYVEQFMTEPVLLRILGEPGAQLIERPVSAQDVLGRYAFRWNGVVATREKITLAAQMERLVPLLVQAQQVAPRLQIDFAYILRRIWSDALGLHGADRAIKVPEDHPSLSPEMTLSLIDAERPVAVRPADDDVAHLRVLMTEGLQRFAAQPAKLAAVLQLIAQHQQQLQAKIQAIQQQQLLAAAAAFGQGSAPNGGAAPGVPQGARPQSMPTGLGGAGGPEADLARAQQLGPIA